jgi:vacuolar-type H+-ATPase subunit C/Vma6
MHRNAGSTLFSNGRIMHLSSKLLTNEKINQILDAEGLRGAFIVLSSFGYGEGLNIKDPNQFETVLEHELKNANKLFNEVCSSVYVSNAILNKFSYHNAKALLKAKLLNIDNTGFMLYESSNVALEEIKKFIDGGEGDIPLPMRGAISQVLA